METDTRIAYPALLVDTERSEWVMYEIVHGPRGFLTFSRVLLKQQFRGGKIFDSSGIAHTYSGTIGWPQLNPGFWKNVIELTMIYPILLFILMPLFRIGPRVVSSQSLGFEEFRREVLEHLKLYNKDKEIARLVHLLDNGYEDWAPASDAAGVVTWVERWNTMLSLEGYDDFTGEHIDEPVTRRD